jgi:hypothetical protein
LAPPEAVIEADLSPHPSRIFNLRREIFFERFRQIFPKVGSVPGVVRGGFSMQIMWE